LWWGGWGEGWVCSYSMIISSCYVTAEKAVSRQEFEKSKSRKKELLFYKTYQ
jgi:hypothetical protein